MLEISELQNVDFSLGLHLSDAFTQFSGEYGPKQDREFMTRPINRQMYRAEHDDPQNFIQAVRTSKATAYTTPDGKQVGLPDLPVIYYFRKPGFSFGDPEDRKSTRLNSSHYS